MNNYMPTTEQVRLDYVMAYSEKESSQILAERDFDRWLVEVERKAAQKALTDAADECAMARAIYGDDPAWGYVNDYGGGEVAAQWEHLGTRVQEMFRAKARAALMAAAALGLSAEQETNE